MRGLYFSSGTDSQFNETTTLNDKTMKTTHNNKLAFAKSSVAELNDDHLNSVNGGSLGITISIVVSFALGYTTVVATQD